MTTKRLLPLLMTIVADAASVGPGVPMTSGRRRRPQRFFETASIKRLLPLLMTIVLLGCGPPHRDGITLVRVWGTVTLDGQPLDKAVVIFESPDGSFAYSATDRSGSYDLQFDSETRGVSTGMKTVRISRNRRIKGLNSFDEGGLEDRAGGSFERQPPELVPEKYNAKSELMASVTASSSRFDFALSTKDD